MSNRFHSKYHRRNHHTYTNAANPDAGHDPIASPENPFLGDFVLQGALSASAPLSAVAGSFYSGNTALLVSSPQTALVARGAVKIEGDLIISGSVNGTTITPTPDPITYTFNDGLEKSISNVVTVKVDNSTIKLNNFGQLAADFSSINLSSSGTPGSYAFGNGIEASVSSSNGATLYTVAAAPDNSTIKISNGKLSLVKDYSFSNGVTFNSSTNTVSAAVDNDSIKVAGGLLKLGYNIDAAGTAITKDTSNNLKVNIDGSTIKVDSSNKLYANFTAGPGLIKDTSNVFSVKYDPASFSINNGFLTSTGNLKTNTSTSQTVAGTVNFTKTIRANDGIRFNDGSIMKTAVTGRPYVSLLGKGGNTAFNGVVATSDNRLVAWGKSATYHRNANAIWPPANLAFQNHYVSLNNLSITDLQYDSYNTAALLSDGTLWVSGVKKGDLAIQSDSNLETAYVLHKVNIPGYISSFKSVANGYDGNYRYYYQGSSFAALTLEGGLYMWGSNPSGSSGSYGPLQPTAPVSTSSGISDVRVYMNRSGETKADFLKDGQLYSRSFDNSKGGAGIGNTSESSTFHECLEGPGLRLVNVAKIANINVNCTSNSYIIKGDGSVWCCGSNSCGQLGIPTAPSYVAYYTKITALSNLNIIDVVVCGSNDYTSVYALTDTGDVYSWGDNSFGQLGHGHTSRVSTPTKISSFAGQSSRGVYIDKIFPTALESGYPGAIMTCLRDNLGNLYAAGHHAPSISNMDFGDTNVTRFGIVPVSNVDDVQVLSTNGATLGVIIKDTSNRVFMITTVKIASSYYYYLNGRYDNEPTYLPTEITNYLV
jgi:alpha-tubulin suppressor-like RCC1 family protein